MVILIVSVVLAFAVSNYANAKAAVNGLSVLLGAYFNLSLVFLPKVSPRTSSLLVSWVLVLLYYTIHIKFPIVVTIHISSIVKNISDVFSLQRSKRKGHL